MPFTLDVELAREFYDIQLQMFAIFPTDEHVPLDLLLLLWTRAYTNSIPINILDSD